MIYRIIVILCHPMQRIYVYSMTNEQNIFFRLISVHICPAEYRSRSFPDCPEYRQQPEHDIKSVYQYHTQHQNHRVHIKHILKPLHLRKLAENICNKCKSRHTCYCRDCEYFPHEHFIDVALLYSDSSVNTNLFNTREERRSYYQEYLEE